MGEVEDEIVYQGKVPRPQVQQNQVVEPRVVELYPMILVNRQQDADQIVDQYRQEDLAVENNLTTIVERIMARNGMNTTPQRSTYSSPLSEYILQTELPRG